ncbi:MAG: right-handed parallel beta-helix repeat-containing protein [bacterium]
MDGDTVLVDEGTYTGVGNRDIYIERKKITVKSVSGPTKCIINCENKGRAFMIYLEGDDSPTINGFTIVNASKFVGGFYDDGGGIYCHYVNPTIKNCIIMNCNGGNGGGIYLDNSSPVIQDCVIANCEATRFGAGISGHSECSPKILDCIIDNNKTNDGGAGIAIGYNGKPEITNCIITNNRSKDSYGGGISIYQDAVGKIQKCTIIGNYSYSGGGGVYVGGCGIGENQLIENSIVWGNSAVSQGDNIFTYNEEDLIVKFSCIEGGWAGQGNISQNPQFRDGPPDNAWKNTHWPSGLNSDAYYLKQIAAGDAVDSPCVDAGNPGTTVTGTTRNDQVIDSGTPDMGAHYREFFIGYNPTNMIFTASEGEIPAPQYVEIWPDGDGSTGMNWTVSKYVPWISLDPLSGTSTGEVDQVAVNIDTSNMSRGTYSGKIYVNANDAFWPTESILITVSIGETVTGPKLVVGPGPAYGNDSVVRVFPPQQNATYELEFAAYGVPHYGVNVTVGNFGGGDMIVTGAGPGAVFGPHVRGFLPNGIQLPEFSFLAYGTNKWGVNVACGNLDDDEADEIITGAGPGEIFGPHVRAWNYNGSTISSIAKVSYFAYKTPKWGVNVAAGDVDGDGYDEIITGAGPGAVYGPHVRGWDVDSDSAVAIPGINFLAYGTNKFGVNVTVGDVDGDGYDEIITGAGPGSVFGAHVRGWNYDGAQITELPNFSFFAWSPNDIRYGAKVYAGADLDGDGKNELIVGGGPDPNMNTEIKAYRYNGSIVEWFSIYETFVGYTKGTSIAAGNF